jgi:hypothetical protein
VSQVQHLHPAAQYATGYACILPRLTAKPSPFCGLTISIAFDTLFLGTINSITVHPREVVKAGLHHNAAAASQSSLGEAEPSLADQRITERLKQALDLVDIRLDHLVVGRMDIIVFCRTWLAVAQQEI